MDSDLEQKKEGQFHVITSPGQFKNSVRMLQSGTSSYQTSQETVVDIRLKDKYDQNHRQISPVHHPKNQTEIGKLNFRDEEKP